MSRIIGLDAGAVSVKLAVLDETGDIARSEYRRHRGRPLRCAAALLQELSEAERRCDFAVTGSAGKLLAEALALPHVNELSALALAVARLRPEVKSVIELGGEDAKYLVLENGGVKHFALNSVCAAGTGAFLDQQAERMRLSIEEFSALALRSNNPPHIAGRCSVFAKSDMIHLQQIATPMEDIVAGLCFSVARNFQGAIIRNLPTPHPVAFMGGVALNKGMIRAFQEVLGISDLWIPSPPTAMSAAGAALMARKDGLGAPLRMDMLHALGKRSRSQNMGAARPPLARKGDGFRRRHLVRPEQKMPRKTEQQPGKSAYMGIDIGSISTCLAVVDEQGELAAKRYIRTASRPIEAVRQGLREIAAELGDAWDVRGVGATGSGRYMISDYIGADVVKNEITAQARGATSLDRPGGNGAKRPAVDTIFEIGGQDSKYIRLENGIITDFEMNKACAAGTGSFLEEQAEKLDVCVKKEFSELALGADAPCALGERCTVFMENSLQAQAQSGADKDALLAGLAYSIVENYINRVVAGRPIGERIFFQGGAAFNKAVVAAFEKFLGKEIEVPPHHDVSGAIGMALIARDVMIKRGKGAFQGFEKAEKEYEQSSFTCKGCDNLCEINKIRVQGARRPLLYGGRCEKYDIRRQGQNQPPDLFEFRRLALDKEQTRRADDFAAKGRPARRKIIGLPRAFFMHEHLPYFSALLWELGYEVRVSPWTKPGIVRQGVRLALADTCFPVKAALGHVHAVLEQGVDLVLLPSFVNLAEQGAPFEYAHACPLTQSFPYQARTAFPKAKILAPVISLDQGPKGVLKELWRALRPPWAGGVSRDELERAMQKADAAQSAFYETLQSKGRDILDGLEPTGGPRPLAILGRAYNAFDQGMNLDIPRKLATLDVLPIPMDFLPQQDVHGRWPEMYWRSGQKLLSAAQYVAAHERLNALFIGNFSCGPDSFIHKFMDRALAHKPYLHVEIDEHSADAGVVTRCEAFLDSLEMREAVEAVDSKHERPEKEQTPGAPLSFVRAGKRPVVYIPRMGDQAFGVCAAFESGGTEARVMDETDAEAIELGRRYVTGKECYPFAVTTGDMLKQTKSPDFDPERAMFFMPGGTGPCRFGQYQVTQKMILERVGLPDTPILSPVQDVSFYADMNVMGGNFARKSWIGLAAVDILLRCLRETRPYERDKGATRAVYQDALDRVCLAVRRPGKSLSGVTQALAKAGDAFAAVPRVSEEECKARPLIGVVGEIFVRTNRFSNEGLVRSIEALGGEAWVAPMDEWVYYVNWGAFNNAVQRREWKRVVQIGLKKHIQQRIAHRLESSLNGHMRTLHDPKTEEILHNASPYVHHSFRGEAVLSIGKAIDMISRGAVGIVNAMPFGCMPGAIVTGFLQRLSDEYGVPCISIPYDGTASPTTRLQLETFMEQARRLASTI